MILPCEDSGTGGRPVVLIHAGVADRRMWGPLLASLSGDGLRTIAPDLPGYGQAPPGSSPLSPWGDVLDTIDDLGLEKVTLVGNSFGALVAKRVAALAPERIDALALISAPPEEDHDPSPRLGAVWEAEESALERGDLDGAVEAVLAAWTLPDASAETRELVARMQRAAFESRLGVAEPEYGPDPFEAAPDTLTKLAAPVLVVVGEHDMSDFHDSARRLVEEVPGAMSHTIAGAGHLAPLERPETLRRLLLELLVNAERP